MNPQLMNQIKNNTIKSQLKNKNPLNLDNIQCEKYRIMIEIVAYICMNQ